MAVVIPLRFAGAAPARRERIVHVLRDGGLDVRRSTFEEQGELYLLRAALPVEPVRASVVELLDRHVPGWREDVRFHWPA